MSLEYFRVWRAILTGRPNENGIAIGETDDGHVENEIALDMAGDRHHHANVNVTHDEGEQNGRFNINVPRTTLWRRNRALGLVQGAHNSEVFSYNCITYSVR